MASNGIQIAAFVLAIIGTIMAFFATGKQPENFRPKFRFQSFNLKFLANHEWARNDTSGSVIESLKTTVGLWARCTEVSTGHTSCDHYDNLLLGSVPILSKF